MLDSKIGSAILVFAETNTEQDISITVRSYPAVTTSTWRKRSITIPGSTPQSLGDDIYRLSIRATSQRPESYAVMIENGQHTATFTVLVKPEGRLHSVGNEQIFALTLMLSKNRPPTRLQHKTQNFIDCGCMTCFVSAHRQADASCYH